MYLIFLFIIYYYTMYELANHVENENEENKDEHHAENENEENFLGQNGMRNTIRGWLYDKRWILLIAAIVVISNPVTGLATYYLKVFPIN